MQATWDRRVKETFAMGDGAIELVSPGEHSSCGR
jgi:hypothetical protein